MTPDEPLPAVKKRPVSIRLLRFCGMFALGVVFSGLLLWTPEARVVPTASNPELTTTFSYTLRTSGFTPSGLWR